MLQKIADSNFFQKILGKIQFYALRGMNYANNGEYKDSGELAVLQFIKRNRKNNTSPVFDVGGNKGGYSTAVRSVFSSETTIHAFEPSKATVELFLNNTKGIEALEVNNFGFGEVASYSTLFSNGDGSGLASVYDRKIEHYGIKLDRKEEIHLSTIDLYCEQKDISNILLLKLDIEGHELSALKGASSMLGKKGIHFIQFECGGTNIDSRTYFKDFYDLLSPNYRMYRILKTGLFEIKRYSETNEVFLSVNYLAVLK
jgi:FkbM family methyltransferase